MHSSLYEETLRSERWRDLKWRRLLIARFACESCGREYRGSGPKGALRCFDLHHLTYRSVGSEDIDHVRVVCRRCHRDVIHGDKA